MPSSELSRYKHTYLGAIFKLSVMLLIEMSPQNDQGSAWPEEQSQRKGSFLEGAFLGSVVATVFPFSSTTKAPRDCRSE